MEGKELGEEKVSAQGSSLKHAGSDLDSGEGEGHKKSRVEKGEAGKGV